MTEQADTDKVEGIAKTDDLPNDLINILAKAEVTGETQQKILTELVPYIVERDGRIFNHAYQVGRSSA
jgi:hypothetical protein